MNPKERHRYHRKLEKFQFFLISVVLLSYAYFVSDLFYGYTGSLGIGIYSAVFSLISILVFIGFYLKLHFVDHGMYWYRGVLETIFCNMETRYMYHVFDCNGYGNKVIPDCSCYHETFMSNVLRIVTFASANMLLLKLMDIMFFR